MAIKATPQQHRGSLDLLKQATLYIKHTDNQLIKHNHTQLLGMNRTFMSNQNEMAKGKTTLHEKKQFQETFLGNMGANTTTINLQS